MAELAPKQRKTRIGSFREVSKTSVIVIKIIIRELFCALKNVITLNSLNFRKEKYQNNWQFGPEHYV